MIKRVLTIAGSDSGGGAGIQADLKTFSVFGVYGMSVITAVTAQNTARVDGIYGIPHEFVSLQFESILTDIGVDGAKTGMLFSTEIVQTISRKFRETQIPYIVVDPIMQAKGGEPLIDKKGVDILKQELIPLGTLVTPNIPEAEVITEKPIYSIEDIKKAAIDIFNLGCRAVLIKGGHSTASATDILFDGEQYTHFSATRIDTKHTHGTGCTYSAAILANLVQGKSLKESIQIAKFFITEAIKQAFPLGKGNGPLNHFITIQK